MLAAFACAALHLVIAAALACAAVAAVNYLERLSEPTV
jgi:hypothetical protein